ncbi:unnamed protein product [Amoebophrya sp. A25]|nr:unnamed protein product [Amoebophrya sp. A25]|eukprot:GSA25T00004182001.1
MRYHEPTDNLHKHDRADDPHSQDLVAMLAPNANGFVTVTNAQVWNRDSPSLMSTTSTLLPPHAELRIAVEQPLNRGRLAQDHDHLHASLVHDYMQALNSEKTFYDTDADMVPLIETPTSTTSDEGMMTESTTARDQSGARLYRFLVFGMNHGLAYLDPAMVDFPVDLIYLDLRKTLAEFFSISFVHQPSDSLTGHRIRNSANDEWDLNFIYVSNSDGNLVEMDKKCSEVGVILENKGGEEVERNDDTTGTDEKIVKATTAAPGAVEVVAEKEDKNNKNPSEDGHFYDEYYSRKAAKTRKKKRGDRTKERNTRRSGKNAVAVEVEQQSDASLVSDNVVKKEETTQAQPKSTTSPTTTSKRQLSCTWNGELKRTQLEKLPRREQLVISAKLLGKLSEKDMQCRLFRRMLRRWDLDHLPGFYPPCFFLPEDQNELWSFSSEVRNACYIWKPGAMWGGQGIELTRNLHELTEKARGSQFSRLHNTQCYGLAALPEADASERLCRQACERRHIGALTFDCTVWNWQKGFGCWIADYTEFHSGACAPDGKSPGWVGGRLDSEEKALVQLYVSDPVLGRVGSVRATPGGEIERVDTIVKTDIRIQGFTHLDPLRVYLSRHGYYRSGTLKKNYTTNDLDLRSSKLMHVTHHIPKILADDFVPGWSGGSLEQWLERFVRKENGMDPDTVWANIKRSLAIWMLGVRHEMCEEPRNVRGATKVEESSDLRVEETPSTTPVVESPDDVPLWEQITGVPSDAYETKACASQGFHFVADMIVDSTGRAWVMEVHMTLGIKSPGLGDPEAGYDELLTRETRQGVFGAISMSFARFMDLPFRMRLASSVRAWQEDESELSSPSLVDMLVEDRMLCRLGMESILPRMWRDVDLPAPDKGQETSSSRTSTSSRSTRNYSPVSPQLADWYDRFDQINEKQWYRSLSQRGKPCREIDFNKDRHWQSKHSDFF